MPSPGECVAAGGRRRLEWGRSHATWGCGSRAVFGCSAAGLAVLAAATVLAATGCVGGSGAGRMQKPEYLSGRNYSYAVFNGDDRLLHSPVDALDREVALRRAVMPGRPISDVYVLVHGWDYTVEESLELYEGYRHALEAFVDEVEKGGADPGFQPFFVFTTWSSVSRPLSDATRSILPWNPPDWLGWLTNKADALAFHFPSSWGESQDAMRIAMGQPNRWNKFDPATAPVSEYVATTTAELKRAETKGFNGFALPLSVVLDELIERKQSQSGGFKLHVVGHSYGGKLASLATHDVVQRRVAKELFGVDPPQPRQDALIDSLVLLLPAMQTPEMFWELELPEDAAAVARVRALEQREQRKYLRESSWFDHPAICYEAVARRIGAKYLVHSRHDSANGWLFALGDLVLDHDAVASAQHVLADESLDRFFYGAYERMTGASDQEVAWPMYLTVPLAPVYGAVQLVARAGYSVVGTVASDASAIVDGLVVTSEELVRDLDGEASGGEGEDVVRDLLSLPVSPFLVQRSIGNQGMAYTRSGISRLLNPWSWIDDAAAGYLGAHGRMGGAAFDEVSGTLQPTYRRAVPPERHANWIVCNARRVYDGDGWISAIPPGAHGDIRSAEKVHKKDPDGLTKRRRTFNFLYNVTRGG